MNPNSFRFYRPCPALSPYVRFYWTLHTAEALSALTFPTACLQLIFHVGTPLYVPELAVSQSPMTISGQVDYPAHLCTRGETKMIVVVFQPYGFRAFFSVPVSELYNLEISGFDLGDRSLEELAATIAECGNEETAVAQIENWLLTRLAALPERDFYHIKRIRSVVDLLLSTPSVTVREMAEAACLTVKQLERVFAATVGASPKVYARMVRFQRSLALMQRGYGDNSLTQIAYRCGYADQSHFIREFRQFSGHTPTSLRKSIAPYSDLFTNPV